MKQRVLEPQYSFRLPKDRLHRRNVQRPQGQQLPLKRLSLGKLGHLIKTQRAELLKESFSNS